MHEVHEDIKRLRRQVMVDLAGSRVTPWRAKRTRPQRAVHLAGRFPAMLRSVRRGF